MLVADDERWRPAAKQAAEQLHIEVACVRIGADVRSTDPDALRKAFGLDAGGASLVRPDGYVAWRSIELPADPARSLIEALGQVSHAARAEVA
ncbi:MAG: hypothetical protein QM820_43720 [Minicystis sp.]